MIVLDTNVLSELMKPKPAVQVLGLFQRFPASEFYLTAITQAEILYGIALLPNGKRKTTILSIADSMLTEDFAGRILPFDSDAAHAFAAIASGKRKRGRPIGQFDAQIAAITSVNSAILATRNAQDFTDCGIKLLNPWEG
jgi:predicted nucleic acid-binding protein